MRSDYLFLAEVKGVVYLSDPTKTKSKSFMSYDYTLNISSVMEPTVVINNVRIATPNLGGTNSTAGGTFTFNPPAIGDYVVCAYLHQDLQAPIALGVISNAGKNQMPVDILKGDGTYLLYHESGTWMRVRNLNNQWKPDFSNNGQNITSKTNNSEWVLHHNDGHEISITKEAIVINHSIGHKITFTKDNFNVESAYGHKLTIDNEKIDLAHSAGQKIELDSEGKILVGTTSHEPMIKGQGLKDWLDSLKNALSMCSVITALGPSGTLGASPTWVAVENAFLQLELDLSTQGNKIFSKDNKVS